MITEGWKLPHRGNFRQHQHHGCCKGGLSYGKRGRKQEKGERSKKGNKESKGGLIDGGGDCQRGREGEEEGEELNKRIRARKRRKEFRKEERERGEKREEERQNLQARRVQHFTEVDHQTQTAPPAYRAKIWADLNYIWAQEEFNMVRGPNLRPSVKMEKTEVDCVKVKKEEEK